MSLMDRRRKASSAAALVMLLVAIVPAWADSPSDARAEELVRTMSAATAEAMKARETGNPQIEANKLSHVRYTGINKLRPLTPEPSAKWRGMGEYWIGFACMGLNDTEGELAAFEKAVLYLGQALDEERGASKALCVAYLGRTRMLLHRNELLSAERRAEARAKAAESLEGALGTGELPATFQSTARLWLIELQRSGDTGDLAIASDPPGASIGLNGEFTGQTTPGTLVLLRPARYEVELTLDGYDPVRGPVLVEAGKTVAYRATLRPEVIIGTIAGTVVDDLGQAVSGATVSIAGRHAVTGAEGGFSISDIVRGDHPIDVMAPGHLPTRADVEILAGRTVNERIAIQRKLGPVSGRVVDVSGEAITGARVWLDGGHPRDTDAEGAFKFTSITDGMHMLKVAAPEYIQTEKTIPLGWDGQITLHSVLPRIAFRNQTGNPLRLFLQWHHPDHGWEQGSWDIPAGQQAYLTTATGRIKADKVRHWAESDDKRTTWRFTKRNESVDAEGDAVDTFAITYDGDDADDWVALIQDKLEAEEWDEALRLNDEMLDRHASSVGAGAALKAIVAVHRGDTEAARRLLSEARQHFSLSGRVAWTVENALDWALKTTDGGATHDTFVIPTFAWLLIGDVRQAETVCDNAVARYDREDYRDNRKMRSLPAMAHLMRGIVRYVMGEDASARGAWNEAERIAGKRHPVGKKARALIKELGE